MAREREGKRKLLYLLTFSSDLSTKPMFPAAEWFFFCSFSSLWTLNTVHTVLEITEISFVDNCKSAKSIMPSLSLFNIHFFSVLAWVRWNFLSRFSTARGSSHCQPSFVLNPNNMSSLWPDILSQNIGKEWHNLCGGYTRNYVVNTRTGMHACMHTRAHTHTQPNSYNYFLWNPLTRCHRRYSPTLTCSEDRTIWGKCLDQITIHLACIYVYISQWPSG